MQFTDDQFREVMTAVGIRLAQAETNGDIMAAVICRDLQSMFLAESMERWPDFREALEGQDKRQRRYLGDFGDDQPEREQ